MAVLMKDAIKPTLMQTLEVSMAYDACPSLAFKFHIVLSCFSPEATLNFQGSSQGQIHKWILENFHLCMLTNQLYLRLCHFMGFFHLLRLWL